MRTSHKLASMRLVSGRESNDCIAATNNATSLDTSLTCGSLLIISRLDYTLDVGASARVSMHVCIARNPSQTIAVVVAASLSTGEGNLETRDLENRCCIVSAQRTLDW